MQFPARASLPNQSFGMWRGLEPQAGGSGSGMGQANSGAGILPQGFGAVGSMGGQWEPSIWYLFAFIVAEVVIFHFLGRLLK